VQIARSRENAVMQGPMRWWDQPPDSRDNTVSMPRIDPAEFTDRESSAPPGPDSRWVVPERPAFGDPYALPAQPEETTRPAQPTGRRPSARSPEPEQRQTSRAVSEVDPAAPSDHGAGAQPDPEAAAARPDLEATGHLEPEAAAELEPEAAAALEPEAATEPEAEPGSAPEPEDGSSPEPADGSASEPADGSAPEPEDGSSPEHEVGSAPEPAAWITPEEAPAATTAAERAWAAATPETPAARPARSVPAFQSQRIVAAAAEPPWPDPQSGPASLASSVRSAVRPTPSQAATEPPSGAPPGPAGAADRPPAGSIADLRARLARLPAGHPASPYDDAGRPKPAPIRLRMLELGLPARPAGVASYAAGPGLDHDDESDELWPDSAGAAGSAASAAPGASETGRHPAAERDGANQPTPSQVSRADTAIRSWTAGGIATTSGTGTASRAGSAGGGETASSKDSADAPVAGASAGSGNATATENSPSTASIAGTANGAETGNSPSTSSTGATASGAGSAGGPLQAADGIASPPGAPATRDDSTKHQAAPRLAAGPGTDRQTDPTGTRDRPDGPATAPPPASSQNGHRDRSASADWQRPYDAPLDSERRSDGPAPLARPDLTTASWPAHDVSPRTGDHRNGNRADEFKDPTPSASARRQAQRSQPRPTDADRPAGRPPAAQRAGRPVVASRLSPEQREVVDRILTVCRAAEGRNAVGGYGNSGLTPAVMRIAAQLPFGGLAPGSEADTLKSADRLAAKLARLLARQPGRSADQVAASIGDVIRYAFTFEAATYTEGTVLVHRKLRTQGFELETRRNRWDSPEYKGVFTRWRDPAHGLPFEVQFHTGQSWAFVKRTHEDYVRITDPATSPGERARLRAQQATAAAVVQQPPGCNDIADLRPGAREQPR
jgi:hypothetical protein